ncbi:MAG: MAPEG family protein [Rhizobiaceae bacterium]
MEAYGIAVAGLLLICMIPLVLANIVGPMKGAAGLVGGPVAGAGDENLIFRLDRAHENSVESIVPFAIAAVLGMLVGVGPTTLTALVWAFLAIRVLYALVYARGGPLGKGGSLRTIVHVLGSLATVALIIIVGMAAV